MVWLGTSRLELAWCGREPAMVPVEAMSFSLGTFRHVRGT